jgi:predicted acyl esterase
MKHITCFQSINNPIKGGKKMKKLIVYPTRKFRRKCNARSKLLFFLPCRKWQRFTYNGVKQFFLLLLALFLLIGCIPDEYDTFMIPMRDGVELATHVYLPTKGEGPWPVLLIRTPYGNDPKSELNIARLSYTDDYALVFQDVRGCFDSKGEYHPFYDDGWGENQDGYDTVKWIGDQSWCNGKIGTAGISANGIVQHLLAGTTPPGLSCQFILAASTDFYSQIFYHGGVLQYSDALGWLEYLNASYWLDTLKEHLTYDSFWELFNVEAKTENINVPAYHIGGWYDIMLKGTINGFVTRQADGAEGAKGNQKLIIGPWTHLGLNYNYAGIPQVKQGELTYPLNSILDWSKISKNWNNYWLKGEDTGIMDEPPVLYYVMGDTSNPIAPGNEWREAETWPPFDLIPTPYYLHSGVILSPDNPGDDGASSTYSFDPENPVPTQGGANLFISAGPYDQRSVEDRDDVILFTTSILEQPLEVTGDVKVILYISSDVLDTDFTAKLIDVYPDGRSMLVTDGIIRTRYRNSITTPELMTSGTVYRIEIDLWATSIIFSKGHRIRLVISSSNYPRFDVNPNTGGDPFDKETMTVANNTIYYNKTYPSHILLPIPTQ